MNIAEKITILNQATLESLEESDKIRIMKRFTNTGIKILAADFGYAILKQSTDKYYRLVYKSPNMTYHPRLPRKRGHTFKAEKTKQPYLGLVKKEKNPKYDITPYMKSIAIVPVFYKKRQYGDIILCYKKRHIFSNEERSLSSALGNAAAQAITINRLYLDLKDFKNRLDQTLDSVFIFDPMTLKIEYANDGASNQLGLPRNELYKRTMVEVQDTYKHEEFKALLNPLLMQEEKFLTAEGTIKNSRGRHIPIEMFLQYIRTPGRPGKVLSIIQDITERKRVEQESRLLLKQKDEFLSIASHELKTPITTIKGFAQLLQDRTEKKNTVQHYFVEKINSQVGILTRLVNDLLDISRIETGKLKFRRKIFELSRLIESITANVQVGVPKHKFILKLYGQFWIFGDADRIGQVLINLITNAVKYSPRSRRVIITLKQEGRFAKVSVEDFGIGVDKNRQQKIFDRFFQGKRDAETYPGLGLGLYISSNIIKSHKGKIFCQSKKTKGTIFSFTIPYKRCQIKKRKN